MLKPIVSFFECRLRNRVVAILFSYVVVVAPLLALLFFFFNQSRILFGKLPPINEKIGQLTTQLMDLLNQNLGLDPEASAAWLAENFTGALNLPVKLVQESFQSGATVLAHMVLIILMTYFMLLYRTAFKNFLLGQVGAKNREALQALFDQLKKLTKRYMLGQGLIILILGLLIGTGLWIIGVPYPFFWGFLAGFLEIIPYVGTTIGGILPFTYMLMVSDTVWQPWAVVGLYFVIQQIEGNLISPNVMGPSIKINPLFIILGLFLGGILWGISGMVLALPILAISKEVFRTFDATKPLSYLMEDGLTRKSHVFLEEFDDAKYRLFHLFFKEREP